jgi:hypothetical protein
VVRAGHPLAHRQQRGDQVPGGGRIPRRPGPKGKLVPGVQGSRVLRAVGIMVAVSVDDQLEQVPGAG